MSDGSACFILARDANDKKRARSELDTNVSLRYTALKREYGSNRELMEKVADLEQHVDKQSACIFLFHYALEQETVIGLRHSFSAQDAKKDIKTNELLLAERNAEIARLMELVHDAPKLTKRNEELTELLFQEKRRADALEQRVQHQATSMAGAHQHRVHDIREATLSAINTRALAIFELVQANSEKDVLLSGLVEHIDAMRTAVGATLI